MNFYDMLKAKAIGNSGGDGDGVRNYMTSTVEVGTIEATGAESDNPNRPRRFSQVRRRKLTVFTIA